ncbi:hypothetical protein BDN72DRAFT_906098 [Pluteus cervinus]|uniref:Uncharacterized protein n=1 Tax=Pluteus cervinus TaxID=181527 RepID=A0ACD3A0E8_9AGAR|nr:hypothetical protein BDN72DRAFT_906098 [Pluteus cervinus]
MSLNLTLDALLNFTPGTEPGELIPFLEFRLSGSGEIFEHAQFLPAVHEISHIFRARIMAIYGQQLPSRVVLPAEPTQNSTEPTSPPVNLSGPAPPPSPVQRSRPVPQSTGDASNSRTTPTSTMGASRSNSSTTSRAARNENSNFSPLATRPVSSQTPNARATPRNVSSSSSEGYWDGVGGEQNLSRAVGHEIDMKANVANTVLHDAKRSTAGQQRAGQHVQARTQDARSTTSSPFTSVPSSTLSTPLSTPTSSTNSLPSVQASPRGIVNDVHIREALRNFRLRQSVFQELRVIAPQYDGGDTQYYEEHADLPEDQAPSSSSSSSSRRV